MPARERKPHSEKWWAIVDDLGRFVALYPARLDAKCDAFPGDRIIPVLVTELVSPSKKRSKKR